MFNRYKKSFIHFILNFDLFIYLMFNRYYVKSWDLISVLWSASFSSAFSRRVFPCLHVAFYTPRRVFYAGKLIQWRHLCCIFYIVIFIMKIIHSHFRHLDVYLFLIPLTVTSTKRLHHFNLKFSNKRSGPGMENLRFSFRIFIFFAIRFYLAI